MGPSRFPCIAGFALFVGVGSGACGVTKTSPSGTDGETSTSETGATMTTGTGETTESGSTTSSEGTGTGTDTGPSCEIDPDTQECCPCEPQAGNPDLCPPSEDDAFRVRGGNFDWGINEAAPFDCRVTQLTETSLTLDCDVVGEGTFTLDGITIDQVAIALDQEVRFRGKWWSDVDGCQKTSWFRIEDRMTNALIVATGVDQGFFGLEGDLLDPLVVTGEFGSCAVEAECRLGWQRGEVRVAYQDAITDVWDGSRASIDGEFLVGVTANRDGICNALDDGCAGHLELTIVGMP